MTSRQPVSEHRMGEVLFHIGLHKSGTTLLQQTIFRGTDPAFVPMRVSSGRLAQGFIGARCDAEAAEMLRCGVATAVENNSGGTAVLSNERLSGYPPAGAWDRVRLAKRLRLAWPTAHVLITIREQSAAIGSMYSQFLQDGGRLTLTEFLGQSVTQNGRWPGLDLSSYDYDELQETYCRIFDPEHVHVVPYELLANAPREFVERLPFSSEATADLLISAPRLNRRRTPTYDRLIRSVNRIATAVSRTDSADLRLNLAVESLYNTVQDALPSRSGQCATPHTTISSLIGSTFDDSNARFSARNNIDLASFGYRVASTERKSAA